MQPINVTKSQSSHFHLQILIELKVAKNKSLPSICIIRNIQNIHWHIIWKNKPKYIGKNVYIKSKQII